MATFYLSAQREAASTKGCLLKQLNKRRLSTLPVHSSLKPASVPSHTFMWSSVPSWKVPELQINTPVQRTGLRPVIKRASKYSMLCHTASWAVVTRATLISVAGSSSYLFFLSFSFPFPLVFHSFPLSTGGCNQRHHVHPQLLNLPAPSIRSSPPPWTWRA